VSKTALLSDLINVSMFLHVSEYVELQAVQVRNVNIKWWTQCSLFA